MDPHVVPDVPDGMHHWLLTSGLRILFIALVTLILIRVGRPLFRRLEQKLMDDTEDIETEKRVLTLVGIFRASAYAVIITVAVLTILAELKVNLGPIIAAAGIGGLAIGFGAQTLVKDVITGFFILLEGQLRVGDIVRINGLEGVVEVVTLRYVRLRDATGAVHYISNGNVSQVSNLTKGYSYFSFSLTLRYEEDPERVSAVIQQIGHDMRADAHWHEEMIEDLELLGIDALNEHGYVLRGRIKTQPSRHLGVGREFNRRLQQRFRAEGIDLAFRPPTVLLERPRPASPPVAGAPDRP